MVGRKLAMERAPVNSGLIVRTLNDAQRALMIKTLRQTNWVVGGPNGAAARLGLKRATSSRKWREWEPRRDQLRELQAHQCGIVIDPSIMMGLANSLRFIEILTKNRRSFLHHAFPLVEGPHPPVDLIHGLRFDYDRLQLRVAMFRKRFE